MLETTPCCGMDLYEGVNYTTDADAMIRSIGEQWCDEGGGSHWTGLVVFTEARVRPKNLNRIIKPMQSCVPELRRLLRTRNLGSLTTSPWKVNPNSGNQVRTLTWLVNWVTFRPFLEEQAPDRNKSDTDWGCEENECDVWEP